MKRPEVMVRDCCEGDEDDEGCVTGRHHPNRNAGTNVYGKPRNAYESVAKKRKRGDVTWTTDGGRNWRAKFHGRAISYCDY